MKNRRKNYYINKKFQRSFIIKFCLLIVLGSIMSGSIIYVMSRTTLTTFFKDSDLVIKSTADYILPAVLLSSALTIALIGIATIAMTLFTSHRIAGPLYRVEKDLEEVASGDLAKRINLRKNDELKMLAQNLNNIIQRLGSDIGKIKTTISILESAPDSKRAKESLKEIKNILSKYIT